LIGAAPCRLGQRGNIFRERFQQREFRSTDRADIVIHNYRWRLSLAPGETRFDAIEQRLVAKPPITVPTVTIGSDFDGTAYRSLYTGPYQHRVLNGIGHNVPQEAPHQFAAAVADVATQKGHHR
jgi:pimeloyl-ACP methyl ester carboxylesterase